MASLNNLKEFWKRIQAEMTDFSKTMVSKSQIDWRSTKKNALEALYQTAQLICDLNTIMSSLADLRLSLRNLMEDSGKYTMITDVNDISQEISDRLTMYYKINFSLTDRSQTIRFFIKQQFPENYNEDLEYQRES